MQLLLIANSENIQLQNNFVLYLFKLIGFQNGKIKVTIILITALDLKPTKLHTLIEWVSPEGVSVFFIFYYVHCEA